MKKLSNKKAIQRKQTMLTWIFGCAPFVLSFALLIIYGFTNSFVLWLVALSSLSWFALTGGYLYALANKWESVSLKKDAFYKGKPITPKEATFFAYVYAVIFFALGVMLAVIFFRELLFV